MKLPLLISLPHAGLWVPPEVEPYCVLGKHDVIEDGDEGAAEIYQSLEAHVAAFVTTRVARAIVDVNRGIDDRSQDGVVKTHTCWKIPVYNRFPRETLVAELLEQHYHPYHRKLTELASEGVKLGVDCHTMAVYGPPVGPDPGALRPAVSLANANETCPQDWLESLASCFEEAFGEKVAVNWPFKGGFIIRRHSEEIPWVQLELSRSGYPNNARKADKVLSALRSWCSSPVSLPLRSQAGSD